MRKLSLNVDELKVESFETYAEAGRGTVHANQGCYTYSCKGTCGNIPDSLIEKDAQVLATFNACCV